jgi:hypothetical protein
MLKNLFHQSQKNTEPEKANNYRMPSIEKTPKVKPFVMPSTTYDDPINILQARLQTRREIAQQDAKIGDHLAYYRNTLEINRLEQAIEKKRKEENK